MAGRIEIDDVAPVVSAGRYPAKAVVGEVVPISATVWREGHDAVAATLVVRYHGPVYPQLAETPPGATPTTGEGIVRAGYDKRPPLPREVGIGGRVSINEPLTARRRRVVPAPCKGR